MRNVQDKKDMGLALGLAVGGSLFLGIISTHASAPVEAPVAPHTTSVTAEHTTNGSLGGTFTTEISGGRLATK